MIDRLLWIDTDNTYPYKNLAMEEYMTTHATAGICTLFLWQNHHTVVIGKNQNCWRECRVNFLEEEGGYLARRLSGGGAVFHDLGNLNFTFIVRDQDYDVQKQLDVILKAVNMLGIRAEKNGRNDITANGRKFSGNAFYRSGGCCYHHGTLLLNADKGKMSRYLNVSKEKLDSKGVASVKSRVVNLCELKPDLTVGGMKRALVKAFSDIYGLSARKMEENCLPPDSIEDLTKKYESWEWKYGRKIPFGHELVKRFPWGDIQIQMHVDGGVIREIKVFSDAMDQEIAGMLESALKNCAYGKESICNAIRGITGRPDEKQPDRTKNLNEIWEDIISFVKDGL